MAVDLRKPPRKVEGAGVVVHDLTFAKHEPGHVLAPGLFRSLAPGARKTLKLDVTYIHGEDQLEFKGFSPLSVFDMRVLQGLIAMSGPEGLVLKDDGTASESGQQLLLDLFDPPLAIAEAGKKPDTAVIRDSFRCLAREIGMDGSGKTIRQIRESVERMVGVTVFVQSGKRRVATRLISGYASDEGTGDLYVALNPRLSKAIFGPGQYVRIDMDEVRALESDPARLIHQRLCGWIDPGKARRVGLDKMAEYVWPDGPGTDVTARRHRQKVRKALDELRGLGWKIEEDRKGICQIIRPRLKSRERNIGNA